VCEIIDGQKCTISEVIVEFKWRVQQKSSGQYVGCD